MTFCRRAFALALLALPGLGSAATPASPPRTRAKTEVFNGSPVENITMRDAINLALRNNLDVKFDHIGIRLNQSKVRFEIGAFDPVFSINMTRESIRRPENANDLRTSDQVRQFNQVTAINDNTDAIRASVGLPPISRSDNTVGINSVIFDQQNDRFSASLIERTPWGMRFGFFVEANRLRNTFSGDGRQVFPEYQTSTSFQVVQPLLKDFGPAANLSNLRVARLERQAAFLVWKQRLMSSINLVMTAYYDMVFGLEEMGVRQDAIAADEKLVQQNQRRLEVGFMQPFDVQQARAQVSLDQEQFLSSKNAFMEKQFALKRLILDHFDVNDTRIFMPRSEPALKAPALDRSMFLQQAFARRPDFQQALAEADRQDIRLRFARNQLLPQLDLVATYGLNGLTSNYGDSFDQGFEGHTPAWTVGINLRVPLGNIQGRAQLDSAKAQKEQAIIRIKQSELAIGVDVDTVLSRIETNRQRLETARKTRELNEEAARIANRRLEEGQISSFDTIEQQRRLSDARSRELGARADLNKSIVNLWLVTGTILEKMGIEAVDPHAAKTR